MKLSTPVHRLKRRARLLARDTGIPLHEALDRMAREEGFAAWSQLSARLVAGRETGLPTALDDGDTLLIAARPGQGKTLLGLRLLLDAARAGRRAVFFTLEYTEEQAMERIRSIDDAARPGSIEIVTSDAICAGFIIRHLSGAPRGTLAIVDYLQILDQQRSKPALSRQLADLKAFAHSTGIVLGFIAQIDRSFDPRDNPVPGLGDLRLPNPIAPDSFSKACFLHAGETRFQSVA